MKKLPTGAARPSKEERHESRRDEIVAAARSCVVRHGFHAASMAQIATTAQMSVGQIYRYFPNKETIVQAIVERIVERRLQWMVEEPVSPLDPDLLSKRLLGDDEDERDDRILLLEVTAEATRNPVAATIVREADARIHAQAEANVSRAFPTMRKAEVRARVELLAVLAEGAAFRRVTGPVVEQATLARLYRDVVRHVLSSPTPATGSTKAGRR